VVRAATAIAWRTATPRLVFAATVFFCPQTISARPGVEPVHDSSGAQAAPAQPERAPERFPINAIDVTGVTKLDVDEVERIIYKYTGPDKSSVDVEAARKAIEAAYAAKGYEAVVVESPVQPRESFEAGIITIAVNEAPVGKVAVTGSKYHSTEVVRDQLSAVKEGEPLNFKTLQTQFDYAGRFPDRRIDFAPKPGATEGTIDVDLTVKDTLPLHASLEVNNDNSPSTTPLRLAGSVRYTDMWKLGHTVSASFILAPERLSDSKVFAGSYLAPILGSRWTMSLNGYYSNSNISALGGTNVLGNGFQVGIRASYRLPTTKSVQSISFGPDFKDFNQDISLAGIPAGSTPIRYVPLSLGYSYAVADSESKFAKKVGESRLDVSANATLGFRAIRHELCFDETGGTAVIVDPAACEAGLPNHEFKDQFSNSGLFSQENFVHFNLTLNYSLATKSDWVFSAATQLQIADGHLVSNEQFGAGGRDTVRGYYQSEEVGDEGLVSSFELASPSLAPHLGKSVNDLRAFVFVDAAVIRTLDVSKGVSSDVHLFSLGAGARARLLDHLSSEIIVGVPLLDGSVSKRGDPRTVFVVRGEF
jgi:hemolysin activation/secretion protein